MAETNKAAQQTAKQYNADIEQAKLEILEKIAGAGNKILNPIMNIQKAVTLCATKLTKTNDVLNRNNNNLKNVLNSLKSIKEQLKKERNGENSGKLSNFIKGAIAGAASRKSAVAPEYKDLGKLVDTVKVIANQQKEQTKSAEKNTQQLLKGTQAQTKMVLLNNDKVEKAKQRKEQVGDNRQKPSIPKEEKTKQKGQRPVLPFSMKEFIKGLGGILSGILNPVSIIIGLIQKFLPYVLLAVAFFMGVWDSLSEELKEKAITLGKKIAKYALLAFALIKGPIILMKTFEVIYHTARMFYLTAKWAKDMILWVFQMKGEAKKQKAESGFLLFRKAKELIRHAAEMLGIAFRNTLAFLQFMFACAGIVIIVAAIILIVLGVIYLISKFSDHIIKAVKTIVEIFRDIGGLIIDAVTGFFKLLFTPLFTLIEGVISIITKAFLGGKSDSSITTETKQNETAQIDNSYTKLVNKVTEPLNSIKNAVEVLRDYIVGKPIEANRNFMTPIQEAYPMSTEISNMNMSNMTTIRSNDSLGDNINSNYVKYDEEVNYTKPIDAISETLTKLQKAFDKFVRDYKNPNGLSNSLADGP